MRKALDASLMRLLQTAALSLAVMTANAGGVYAETVIGADGAPGASCPLISDPENPWCYGGNGGIGESVVATGNPAVAYGGNGGAGGVGTSFGSYQPENDGYGGDGGSAMATAEASAARGDATASAMAVGGSGGGGNYHGGGTWSGDASASAIAISGDVVVQSTAVETGGLEPGPLPLPGASASALSVALPDKAHAAALIGGATNVAAALLGPRDRVFGIASLSTFGYGDYSSTFGTYPFASATFSFPYQGNLLLGLIDGFGSEEGPQIDVNGYAVSYSSDNSVIDLGSNLGPNIDVTVLDFDQGGGLDFEIAIGGAVPQAPTWAMMMIGFAGLGFAGYRTSRGERRTV